MRLNGQGLRRPAPAGGFAPQQHFVELDERAATALQDGIDQVLMIEPRAALHRDGRAVECQLALHRHIRFSLGKQNTSEDVDFLLERVVEVVSPLRELSPLWRKHSAFSTQHSVERA